MLFAEGVRRRDGFGSFGFRPVVFLGLGFVISLIGPTRGTGAVAGGGGAAGGGATRGTGGGFS